MVLSNFVCPLVVLVSFYMKQVMTAPVIKNNYPQDPKLDPEDNINLELAWLSEPRFIASLIGSGEFVQAASPSASTVINPKPTPLGTSGDKLRAGSEKSRASSDKNRADSEKSRVSSDKNRTNFDKTRDSLKPPVTHQPKRRDESKVVEPPPGLNQELFELLHQYHQLTRADHPSPGTEVRITIFPSRRGKQVGKVDAIQKIADPSEADEGNVQKIQRKVEAEEAGEKLFDLEAIVGESDEGGAESEDLSEEGGDDSLEELLGGNSTDTSKTEEEDNETIMQKIRQTDCYAIIYLGAFVALVTCFFFLACSEIFCRNCIDTSNVFLPEAHINESYYRTYHPKPSTPPPPYHLFAPPLYQDIVKDAPGKIVPCCPVRTPCPPYRKEMETQHQETQGVSIIHLSEACPPYQVTPAAAAFMSLLADTSPAAVPPGETSAKVDSRETVKAAGEIFEIHRVPTEPKCPCLRNDSEATSPFQSSPIQPGNVFTQMSFTGQEKPFRNSVSFSDQSCLDGQNQFASDEKSANCQNQNYCDQRIPNYVDELSLSVEKVNETDKSALSAFMKDNREFRDQLKTRIRNSVSFSLSQPSPCSQQLDTCQHSVSYAEQIDQAFATDDLIDRTQKRQRYNSCFAIGSLHHSIPELINLSNNTTRSTNNSFENSHQSHSSRISAPSQVRRETASKDSQTENLLESCLRASGLANSPSGLEPRQDYSNTSGSVHRTERGLHNDAGANETISSTCDQGTNTCYQGPSGCESHQENLKTKIFFIHDADEDDPVEFR